MKLSHGIFLSAFLLCAPGFIRAQNSPAATPAPTAKPKKEGGFVWSDKDIDDVEKARMIQTKKTLVKMADELKASTPEHRETKEYVEEFTRFAYMLKSEGEKPAWNDTPTPDFGNIYNPSPAALAAFDEWAQAELKARKEAAEKAQKDLDDQVKLQAEEAAKNAAAAEAATGANPNGPPPQRPPAEAPPDTRGPAEKAAADAAESLKRLDWQVKNAPKP